MSATLRRVPSHSLSVPDRRAATVALARVEGRRLLRHPFVVVGAELGLYLQVSAIASGQVPVAPRDDVEMAYALLPLAALTLLATNWAALRGRLNGTEELYGSVPTAMDRRTAAHLLSVIAPVGLAVGTVMLGFVFSRLMGGVGAPNPFELITGPAVVALAGAFGVLLARLAPWIGVAPVTVVGVAASWYFPYLLFRATGDVWIWRSYWLFPWFGASGSPKDWADSFAGGWHFAYVGGLVVLTVCLALARHRLRIGTIVAAVLALTLTVTSARVQVPPPTQRLQLEEARFASGAPGTQVCDTRGGVEWCVWDGYQPWIDRWRRPIDGVLRRLPAGTPGLQVRQMELGDHARCWDQSVCPGPTRAVLERAMVGSDVRPTSRWPRGSGLGRAELLLAVSVGAWAAGLSTAPPPDSQLLTICIPREARAVVALWLAGQSTPEAADSLRTRTGPREQARSRMTLGSDVVLAQWPWPEAAYAVALLDRPADEVAAELHRDWARWTSPSTSTAELVEAFGLQPLPPPDEATQVTSAEPENDGQQECE